MKLYHASTVRVEHPDVQHSRPNLDFGCGFFSRPCARRPRAMLSASNDVVRRLS